MSFSKTKEKTHLSMYCLVGGWIAPAVAAARESSARVRFGVEVPRRRRGNADRRRSGRLLRLPAAPRYSPQLRRIKWVSCLRERYGLPALDAAKCPACNFYYDDYCGALATPDDRNATGAQPSPTRCYIEVKSTTHEEAQPFQLSAYEWQLAQDCSDQPSAQYFAFPATSVCARTHLDAVLFDPVRQIANRDLLMLQCAIHPGPIIHLLRTRHS